MKNTLMQLGENVGVETRTCGKGFSNTSSPSRDKSKNSCSKQASTPESNLLNGWPVQVVKNSLHRASEIGSLLAS